MLLAEYSWGRGGGAQPTHTVFTVHCKNIFDM